MKTLLAFAVSMLLAILVSGCGGGSSSGSTGAATPPPTAPPSTQNEPVGGIWYEGGERRIDAMVAEDGRAYFLETAMVRPADFNWRMYWGELISSGSNVTGNFTFEELVGNGTNITGTARLTGRITGRGHEKTIEATLTRTYTGGAINSTALELRYNDDYEYSSSIELISGTYQEDGRWYSGAILDISRRDGSLFLQDPVSTCVLNGQVSTIHTSFNMYEVIFSHSGCTDWLRALNGVTLRGLGIQTGTNGFTIYSSALLNGSRPFGHPIEFR